MSAQKRDVVMVGGLWLQPSVWDEVAAELTRAGHATHVVALPGQGDGRVDATLDDQLAAITAAVGAAGEQPLLVGHSAASSLVWLAADRDPTSISAVVMIGGFPGRDGTAYADFFPMTDGAMPFPGWDAFEDADVADLDAATRDAVVARMVPVPEAVARGTVTLRNDARFAVPVMLICPEYSPAEAKAWVNSGDLPELAAAHDVTFVDIDSGHWPMVTRPGDLAALLAEAADTSR